MPSPFTGSVACGSMTKLELQHEFEVDTFVENIFYNYVDTEQILR